MLIKFIISLSLLVIIAIGSPLHAQYVHPFDTFNRFEDLTHHNDAHDWYDINLLKSSITQEKQIDLGLCLTEPGISGTSESEKQFIYKSLGSKKENFVGILDFRLSIIEEEMSLGQSEFASGNLAPYQTFSLMNPRDERNKSFSMHAEINKLNYLPDNFLEIQRNTNHANKFSFSLPTDSLKNNSSGFPTYQLDLYKCIETDQLSYLASCYKKNFPQNPSIHQSIESINGPNHLADLELSSSSYPDFSFSIQNSGFVYDVFDTNSFTSVMEESSDNSSVESKSRLSNRQRRVAFVDGSTYTWEIKNFSNPAPPNYDAFTFVGNGSLSLYIKPVSSVDKDNDGTSSNGSVAFSSVYNQDSPASPKLTFLTSTNTYTISSIDQSLWRYVHQDWAGETNWSWGVEQSGPNYNYYLSYNTNGFTLSVVPEPSTYFMTGALFCLIGCNRQSRKAFKHLFSKVFSSSKEKVNCKDIKNQLS